MIPRRTATHWLVGSLLVPLAGCGNPNAAPVKKLSIVDITVDKRNDYWQLSLDVGNTYQARDELAKFTDVTVLAYDRNRRRVCSEYIGNVTADDRTSTPISVEMSCPTFPTMITFDAAESPCDNEVRTVIRIAIHVKDEDYGDYWSMGCRRRCGEGLPPKPRVKPDEADDGCLPIENDGN